MVDNNSDPATTIELPPNRQAVRVALDLLEQFLVRQSVGGETREKLAIIVEELVANSVEHGALPTHEPITLSLERHDSTIMLHLTDGGIAFDPTVAVAPDPNPPERGGGAGLALVQRWATGLRYQRAGGRNMLAVSLRLEP